VRIPSTRAPAVRAAVKARAASALLCAVMLALVPSACGSTSSSSSSFSADSAAAPAGESVLSVTGAKVSGKQRQVCVNATLGALQGVAKRIYGEVAEGRILAQALDRVSASRALAQAVEKGEAKAAARLLRELQESQIVRASVSRDGRALATIGVDDAIAPAKVHLLGAGGEVVGEAEIAIDTADQYAKTVLGITGMQVAVHGAGGLLASTLGPAALHMPREGQFTSSTGQYHVSSFTGGTFAGRKAIFSLLVPDVQLAQCYAARLPAAAQIVANALGGVGMSVYRGELSAEKVRAVVREVERSLVFRTAVEQRNPTLAREEIIALFRSRLHVVRVRVETPAGVLVDVGGPYVLAPVRGAIRGAHGHVIGHFLLSLQDDMGYMLLAHAFTGAQVLMRVGTTQVMSTLQPGPVQIPNHGPVSYGGVTYQAFSFLARAFPEGQLRISLLFPPIAPA
jgi:hypothetical protein